MNFTFSLFFLPIRLFSLYYLPPFSHSHYFIFTFPFLLISLLMSQEIVENKITDHKEFISFSSIYWEWYISNKKSVDVFEMMTSWPNQRLCLALPFQTHQILALQNNSKTQLALNLLLAAWEFHSLTLYMKGLLNERPSL